MGWFWAVLLIIGGVVETVALATGHPEWTLSEFVWRACNVTPGQSIYKWTAVHVLLALALIWLWFHFVFRIWR